MWQSNGLSDERIKSPATSGINFNLRTDYIYNVKIRVKSHGSCLKQDKLLIDHKTVLDFYFLHEINLWLCNFAVYFALGNSFSAESNKNVHPYKPFYSGYVTGWMHVKLSSGYVTGWKHMKLSRFLMVLGLVVKT